MSEVQKDELLDAEEAEREDAQSRLEEEQHDNKERLEDADKPTLDQGEICWPRFLIWSLELELPLILKRLLFKYVVKIKKKMTVKALSEVGRQSIDIPTAIASDEFD